MKESFWSLVIASTYVLVLNAVAYTKSNDNGTIIGIGIFVLIISLIGWFVSLELDPRPIDKLLYWIFQNLIICVATILVMLADTHLLNYEFGILVISSTFIFLVVLSVLYIKNNGLVLADGGKNE